MFFENIIILDLFIELFSNVINLFSHSLFGDVHVTLHKFDRLFSCSCFHCTHFLLVGLCNAVKLSVEELLVKFHDLWGDRNFGEASSIAFIGLHSLLQRSLF
jgi:hypothetical protein